VNKLFTNNIGDLAEAQRASFYRFLSTGISEELANFPNPFLAKIRVSLPGAKPKKSVCLVSLDINKVKLKGPNFNFLTCVKKDISYTIQIYVSSEYSYFHETISGARIFDENIKRVKQDIFFGEIPLMTEEGTFLISGCERVVISQIIRSPGIYFRKEFGTSRKVMYTATVISNKGLWTKFILDEKPPLKKEKAGKKKFPIPEKKIDRIYIKLNDFKMKSFESKKSNDSDLDKLFIFDLISYFGLGNEEIMDMLKYPLHFPNQQLSAEFEKEEFNKIKSWAKDVENEQTQRKREGKDLIEKTNVPSFFDNNLDAVHYENRLKQQKLKSYTYETNLLIKRFFFNQRSGCFSIGEIGRYKINKKLGLNLPKDITYLTPFDLIGIVDGLIELKYYDRVSDDIDDIKNKQIRSIGELLQNQIKIGLYRLQKGLIEQSAVLNSQKINFDLETSSDPEDWIIDPRPISSTVREFFKTSQLSQYMDQINPLAELTHKRRISVFGPNGLKRDQISVDIR
jgi:DNA-directed RNA polymerase subunit beta